MSAGAMTSRSDLWAESLAEQISAYDPQPRDVKAVGRAKAAVIVAFGQALSGAPAAITKALLNTPGVAMTGRPSLIFGTERRTSAIDAALVNATAAAAGSEASRDAANAACIVALFGLCEERQKTGQEFLDALMFGAALASTFLATAGQPSSAVFSGFVAATRVLELSPPKIAAALLMAGMANPGSSPIGEAGLSSLMVGLSLRNGLLAALLADAMDETNCTEMARSTNSPALTGDGAPAEAAHDLFAIQSPPGADLWDLFERQAGVVLPRDHIAPLFEGLETIDKVKDLATISRLLQGRGTQVAARKVVFAPRGAHEPEETNWVP
jgi:hypothetical protein